jgi:hypothetical protein
VPSLEQSSTTTTSATHGCVSTSCRTASTVARSLKTGMMTETFGFVFKDALIVSQFRFAALLKKRKTVPDECYELVTIVLLAETAELSMNVPSVRSVHLQIERRTENHQYNNS